MTTETSAMSRRHSRHQETLVQLLVAPDHFPKVKLPNDLVAARAREASAELVVLDEPDERRGQSAAVARRHQQAAHVMIDDFRNGARRRGQNGRAKVESFGEHQSEGLRHTSQDEDVRGPHQVRKVPAKTEEAYSLRQTKA